MQIKPPPQPKTAQVNIRFDAAEYALIESHAARHGVTANEYIRQAMSYVIAEDTPEPPAAPKA